MRRPQSITTKLKVCDEEVAGYVRALEKENLRLQNKIHGLEAKNVSLQHEVTALKKKPAQIKVCHSVDRDVEPLRTDNKKTNGGG
jgi:hypothetical protein